MKSHSLMWVVLATLLSFSLFSCSEFDNPPSPIPLAEETSAEIAPQAPVVASGMLVFKDMDHFLDTWNYLAEKPRHQLDEWETGLGFQSMRFFFDQADDEFETIRDEAHLETFKATYADKVVFAEDGTLEMKLDIYYLASLLNTQGLVKVGEALHYYDKDKTYLVLDGDPDKMAMLLTRGLTTSNLEEGIIYIKKETIQLDGQDNTRTGGTNFEETEVRTNGNRNGSRRLRISAKLHTWTQPIYVSHVIPTSQWINFWRVITKAESHEKKWWGWKGRTTDFYNETLSYVIGGNNTYSVNSFGPVTTLTEKKIETYWDEWETIQSSPLSACFTSVSYSVQGGSQNWATATITY